MKRRLFVLAVALSLLLWAMTTVLWVRSYFRQDFVTHVGFDRAARVLTNWAFISDSGGAAFAWESVSGVHAQGIWRSMDEFQSGRRWAYQPGPSQHYPHLLERDNHLGFDWLSEHGVGQFSFAADPAGLSTSQWGVVFPSWLPAVIFSILPAVFGLTMWYRMRKARLSHSLCRNCGYDLRASPQRCPECGSPVPQSSERAV